jgi:polyphosphate glucokinase
MEILGIDIGGTGIKGAPVDVERGVFTAERHRIPTPQPSTPQAVADVVAEIADGFSWKGPIGCTFPAVIKQGVVHTAANVDEGWIGVNAQQLLQETTGCPVILVNDADAAGIAEMKFGAGQDQPGVVFILTFGTGIGSAVFVDGVLMPNTELGHMEVRGKDAENRAADSVRRKKDLSWGKWAKRVNEYLAQIEFLFSPDLIIFGGGVSKKYNKYFHLLNTNAPLIPARLFNDAGIVGAAMAASHLAETQSTT